MTLNKFCPVAQGEYYNIKSPSKSQPFFTCFFTFLYIFYGAVTHTFHLYNIWYILSIIMYYICSFIHIFTDSRTKKRTRVHIQNVPGSLSSIYIYEFLPSSVNQNSTPFSQFFTPYCWLCASMIALTIERPIPVPPYARVLALSTL